jgi:sigma-B regulation protein RsbU (phosphoserine phosphatase)
MVFKCELGLDTSHGGFEALALIILALGQQLRLAEEVTSSLEKAAAEALTLLASRTRPGRDDQPIVILVESSPDSVAITFTHHGQAVDFKNIGVENPGAAPTALTYYPHLPACSRLMDNIEYHPAAATDQPHVLLMKKGLTEACFSSESAVNLRELRAMLNVSQSMASDTDLDELLALIVDELVTAIDVERATLYLIDDRSGQLYSHVLSKETGDLMEIRLKMGEGLAGHVAATGETINIKHAYQDRRFHASYDRNTGFKTESVLVMPLCTPQHKIIGVVQLLNKRRGPFTIKDEHLLSIMAAQAAVRIENARLYAQEIVQKILSHELETARLIQESFLPRSIPMIPGFDIAGACDYCDQTGGDYYDVFPVDHDRQRFVVLVGDVSGHGLPAALLMATGRALIRLRSSMPGEPQDIIRDVNRRLSLDTMETGEFMTLFYCDIPSPGNTLRWVRAGHEGALVYDTASGDFHELQGEGVALGLDESYQYRQYEASIPQGAVILIGTDGIWEMHNEQGQRFGKAALKQILKQRAAEPAASILAGITRELEAFRGQQQPQDDVTMVILKFEG